MSGYPEHPVYYRVMIDRENSIYIACLQDFDERDYDQARFLTEDQFPSKEAAEDWIVANMAFVLDAVEISRALGLPMFAALNRNR